MKRTYEEIANTIIVIALENFKRVVLDTRNYYSNQAINNDELQMIDDLIKQYRKGIDEEEIV